MGRKRDESAWKYVEGLKKNRFRCKFCELDLSGGASRIKAHLGKFKREGIKICTKVTKEVQAEFVEQLTGQTRDLRAYQLRATMRQMEENTPMKEKNKDLIMQGDFFINLCTPSEPHTSPLVEDLHDVHLEHIDFDPNLAANMEDLGIQNHNLDGNWFLIILI
uniref:BED-type domain-containing protein n=1 Tax=Quercus lobata TaxID=97700 RepID=A0A7N2MUB4_QUELO